MIGGLGVRSVVSCAAIGLAATNPVRAEAGKGPKAEPVRLERDGLKLEMAPLAPDQVRAFFLARGFSSQDAEHIVATGCVFRTAIGSSFVKGGDPEVRVALASWRINPEGKPPKMPRAREDWEAIWKQRGVGEEPATAFYWSLFPTEQSFAPTDYNWGFLTFGLPPGARFALELRWSGSGKVHSARLENLECGK
jgi:hypothetical protein